MPVPVVLGCALALCLIGCFAEENAKSGPYRIQIDHFKACDDTGKNEIKYYIAKEPSTEDAGRSCYTGNITLDIDFNDDVSCKVDVDIMSKDTWKEMMKLNFKKGCNDLKKYESNLFPIVKTYFNFSATDCPIPKGVYSFKCTDLNKMIFKSQSSLTYGKYRVYQQIWKGDEKLSCLYIEGDVLPA